MKHLVALATVSALALILTSGCSKKEAAPAEENTTTETAPAAIEPVANEPAANETAANAPAAENNVDLSQATDMFNAPAAVPTLDPTTVVAVVEGKDITQAEVNEEVAGVLTRMQGRVPPERIAQMQSTLAGQTLDALVTKTLLVQTVDKENIAVTDVEIDEAVSKITNSLPPGKTLDDILKNNNKSLEDFRKDLKLELRVNKLLEQQATNAVKPTDEEIAKYYDENKEEFQQPETVHASHILIATEKTDTDEQKAAKKAKAEELRQKLVAGEDFASCASTNSDCPSKTQGGDLGEFQRGQMVKPFEDAAFSQAVGEVGPVVETQFGYHIIKVQEHKQAKTLALEEVKDKLSDYLAQRQKQTSARDYVVALKAKANITYPQGKPSMGPDEAPTSVQ